MRRVLRWLLPVALLTAALAAYDYVLTTHWDGGYEVTVSVQRTGARAISSAKVAASFRGWWDCAGHDPNRLELSWQPVDLRDGTSFPVDVQCSGANSGWGRQLSYVRQEVLLVKVVYANGDSALVVADLPASAGSRALLLQIP